MTRLRLAVVLVFLTGLPVAAATLQETYLKLYLEMDDAEQRELAHDYIRALVRFQAAEVCLVKMHANFPDWEPDMVRQRTKDCQEKITELTPLAREELRKLNDAWPLNDAGMQRDGWSDVDWAQAKLTYWQLMKGNHPNSDQGTFDAKIREQAKVVDGLVTTAVGKP